MVLEPSSLKVSRSLRRRIRRDEFRVTVDRSFAQVVRSCAAPRATQSGTWTVQPGESSSDDDAADDDAGAAPDEDK